MSKESLNKCLGCGAIWDTKLDYCAYCGSPRPPELLSAIDSGLSCTKCHKDDKVVKVSSIYRGETHQINGTLPVNKTYTDSKGRVKTYTTQERYSATQKSDLAIALTPPDAPDKPILQGRGTCLGWTVFLLFGIGLSLALRIFDKNTNSGTTMQFIWGLGLLFAAYLVYRWRKSYINKKKAELLPQMAEWEEQFKCWQDSMRRWEKLYYCYRDDIVFLPDIKRGAPLNEMRKFIYQGDKYKGNND